ncbi:hypothetical protein MBLNU13_g04317t1 [Cladosporium sp. NU13]
MPSLQTLPIELRQKIYGLALIPADTTKIAAYPRQNASDHLSNEVALAVLENGRVKREQNNDTALIRVSKDVSADSRPLLYASYHFTFQNSRALELFLEQIGPMKQHLRHVELGPNGYEHDIIPEGPLYRATKHSFAMLAAATGLQTLGVSHFDFCRGRHLSRTNIGFPDLVDESAQLLLAIHRARNAGSLKTHLAGMLDIVRFELPDCAGCFSCDKSGAQRLSRRRSFKQYSFTRHLRCYCNCSDAESNNEELTEEFKRCVAAHLQSG